MGVIYLRTNNINGKKYVGQVITKRFKARQNKWNNLNLPYAGNVINNARKKYGIESFDFEILKECNDNELDYWEKYYIKELNTKKPYGYNMTDGGGGMSGFTISEETRKKMSETHKGEKHPNYGKHLSEEIRKKLSDAHRGKKLSDETRKKIGESLKGKKLSEEAKRKISEAHKGEKHWNYGKHLSEETKRKISEAHKGEKHPNYGKHLSEETRKKLSETHRGEKHWNYGKHHSDETKKKMSEAQRGKKNHMYGKHLSEEAKNKISEANSKPVLQINKDTNEVIAEFPSIKEVERQLGINNSHISQCCNGNRKTCGGFKWQYK